MERVELDIKGEVFDRGYTESVPGITRFNVKRAGGNKKPDSMASRDNSLIVLFVIN